MVEIQLPTVVMSRKICYIDQNWLLYEAVNMIFSDAELGPTETDLLLEPILKWQFEVVQFFALWRWPRFH